MFVHTGADPKGGHGAMPPVMYYNHKTLLHIHKPPLQFFST